MDIVMFALCLAKGWEGPGLALASGVYTILSVLSFPFGLSSCPDP